MRKNKAGGLTLPDGKLHYKAIVIKTAWCWCKHRHIEQWSRRDPCLQNQLLFNKEPRTYNAVTTMYSINRVGKIGQIHAPQNEVKLPSHTTRIKSKWIKDLNVRLKTIKIIEGNLGSKITDISLSSNFFLMHIVGQGK